MAKILIAEDEPDIRELVSFTLQYHGHEIIMAKNGEDALDLVYKEKPDLILLDVRMPRLDGYEVCRRINQDPVVQSIPIAFLSAKGQEAEVSEGFDAGAVDYIVKPFSPEQLMERVNAILST
jgi:DNA-binding response OmpR family regulator